MTSSTRTSQSSLGNLSPPQGSPLCRPSLSPTASHPPPSLLPPALAPHPPPTLTTPNTGPPSPVLTSAPCTLAASARLQRYPRRSGAAPRCRPIRTGAGVVPRGGPSTRGSPRSTITCRKRSCCTPRPPSPSSRPSHPCPRAMGECLWPSTWPARTQTFPLVHRRCLRRGTSTVSDGEMGCGGEKDRRSGRERIIGKLREKERKRAGG